MVVYTRLMLKAVLWALIWVLSYLTLLSYSLTIADSSQYLVSRILKINTTCECFHLGLPFGHEFVPLIPNQPLCKQFRLIITKMLESKVAATVQANSCIDVNITH